MRQYYYTVSVLPAVHFDEPPLFSADDFLEECERFVSPADMEVIRSATPAGGDDRQGTVGAWNEFARTIREELARLRLLSLGWESDGAAEYVVSDPRLAEFARNMTLQDNPRKAELSLLQRMWEFLDELELGHFFDRERLVVYYLRLQISDRRAKLTDLDAGNDEFTRQYEEVAQTTMEIV